MIRFPVAVSLAACPWRGLSWARRASATVLCAALAGLSPARSQEVSDEYRLKAAFIYRFPQFVDWPTSALAGRQALELCVLAPTPFGPVLEQLVLGDELSGLPYKVRVVNSAAQATTCHVFFLSDRSATRRAVLRQVSAMPILTVSDAPRFLEDGGIVQLVVIDKRVRFEINAAAANHAGLRLSSQLMRLAVSVRGGPS